MRHEGLTVFLLFFGLALLDAITTGRWVQAAFWIAVGACFVVLDRWSHRNSSTHRRGNRPFWA